MEVTVSRTLKINMGNYESMDSFAAVKVTVPSTSDIEALAADLSEKLDTVQFNDIELAHNLTGFKNSYVHSLVSE